MTTKYFYKKKKYRYDRRKRKECLGLFNQGQTSLSILREPAISEKIVARAEENLSRILQLNRDENLSNENKRKEHSKDASHSHTHYPRGSQEYGKTAPRDASLMKRETGSKSRPRRNEISRHPSLERLEIVDKSTREDVKETYGKVLTRNESYQFQTSHLYTSMTSQVILANSSRFSSSPIQDGTEKWKNASLSNLRDLKRNTENLSSSAEEIDSHQKCQKSPRSNQLDFAFYKFSVHIKQSFIAATKKLSENTDIKSELGEVLRNYHNRNQRLTPPPKLKDASIGVADSSITGITNTSRRMSGKCEVMSRPTLAPDFDETIGPPPPTVVINSQAMLRRYEQKLGIQSKTTEMTDFKNNFCSLPQSPFSFKEKRDLFTPFKNLEVNYKKAAVDNPLNFIEMYEKKSNSINNSKLDSRDENHIGAGSIPLSVFQEVEYVSDRNRIHSPKWKAGSQNWPKFLSPSVDYQNFDNYNSSCAINSPFFYADDPFSSRSVYTNNSQFSSQPHCPPLFSQQPNIENITTLPYLFHQVPQASSSHEYQNKNCYLPFSQTTDPVSPQVFSPAVDTTNNFYSNCKDDL